VTLGEKQRLFTRLVGILIEYAYQQGYELTFGDAYRSPEQAEKNTKDGVGIKASLHVKRLAVDFNLFKEGIFITDTQGHYNLGVFWESLHPLCRWGGRFVSKPDGNHYSLEHEGVK
jgi:hypothetical protein